MNNNKSKSQIPNAIGGGKVDKGANKPLSGFVGKESNKGKAKITSSLALIASKPQTKTLGKSSLVSSADTRQNLSVNLKKPGDSTLTLLQSLHAQMKSNKEELRIGFDKLAQKQDSSTAELREEINEVREWQKTLNANQQAELQMVERQRPLKNGVTQEDIDKARTVNIDLTLSMIVISKCDKARGEAVSLIRHNYMNGNRNKLCRAIFDDLWSKREQADHSMEGGTGRYGNFEEEGMAKFKAASVIQLGLEDFLANWPTILASLKQKINDLRSKDFKGEYEARRALKKEFDEPARASVKSKSTILSCLQESCPTGDGNLDDLDFHDLIQSSQRSFSNLNFLDDEALESGFDRNADEDEDDENDEDVLQFLDD